MATKTKKTARTTIIVLILNLVISVTFYIVGVGFAFAKEKDARAQGIFEEKIRKISPVKRSVYLTEGIFIKTMASAGSAKDATSESSASNVSMNSIRHLYKAKEGFERIVFDFNGRAVPKMYAYVSNEDKKLYLDFFNTSVNSNIASLGKGHFVKNLLFYPIEDDLLSVEVEFKRSLNFEIFYLDNPGRLVVDVKI
ncbi:MAG: hypothetical protein HQK49_10320 [Oligoflexia bacterium]|nr:hypothetical protein [Oligoflexia bacterium]